MTSICVVANQKSDVLPGCWGNIFSMIGFKSLVCCVWEIFGKEGIIISLGIFFLFSLSKLHFPPSGLPSSLIKIFNFLLVFL